MEGLINGVSILLLDLSDLLHKESVFKIIIYIKSK
jgi:hypothetical protein